MRPNWMFLLNESCTFHVIFPCPYLVHCIRSMSFWPILFFAPVPFIILSMLWWHEKRNDKRKPFHFCNGICTKKVNRIILISCWFKPGLWLQLTQSYRYSTLAHLNCLPLTTQRHGNSDNSRLTCFKIEFCHD